MLSIRRIIVCVELSRLRVAADNSSVSGLGKAFANSARVAGINKLPMAVAGILPSVDQSSLEPPDLSASPDLTLPLSTICFRSLIEREAAAVGVVVSDYEEFTTDEWCQLLASEKCHSDVLLAGDLQNPLTSLEPPIETMWLNALKNFGGILWLHNSAQDSAFTTDDAITDIIAPVTSNATAMENIFVAVNAAKALQARLWIVPGRLRNTDPAAGFPDASAIHHHMVNCDYRTLPFGVQVAEVTDDVEEAIRTQLKICDVPLILQWRNPSKNSDVLSITPLLFNTLQTSVLLLPGNVSPGGPSQG